jgi:hypothetical protein
MTSALQPLPRERRHPADYRDDIEHAEVAAVLSELPEDHPARIAHYSGAREASDSIQLTHLVKERPDLVQRLTKGYLAHGMRINLGTQCSARLGTPAATAMAEREPGCDDE